MATSTKLSLNFAKSNGNSMNLSYSYARQDASNANIKALMQGTAAIRSAKIITTETTDVDLS